MVGMGWSGKSPTKAYRLVDHIRYVDAWFDALQLTTALTILLTHLHCGFRTAPGCRCVDGGMCRAVQIATDVESTPCRIAP
jgi:hypothetical protein